jgi:putative heme-binding domain-containing protein
MALVLSSLILSTGHSQAAEPKLTDFAGTWNLSFSTPDGAEHKPVLLLTQDGIRLKGIFQKLQEADLPAKNITLKAGELRVSVSGTHEGDPFTLTFIGKPKGEEFSGEAEVNHAGNNATFTFEGKRVAKPAPKPPSIVAGRIKAPKGFEVELIYTVPQETQGSWVNMTPDPKGRLIVSDQYGKLYRVTPPPLGSKLDPSKIEPIDLPIGEAQGLLWAFDSLYVVVNRGRHYESGLYRVTDTNADDKLDKVEQLRKIEGNGEHGPHAIVLAPDGKSLYFIAGNSTTVPAIDKTLVPPNYGEDNLLPRMVDGSGFMTGEKAPGGFVARVSPDGSKWDLVAIGFRNPFDLAFNRDGELFTYDSDMEWDVNTPWYRPTRVLHVVKGGDYGYRNGAGKWPPYYMDSLPPVVNVGPGSPTGVTFGYGAKFPKKYEDALFISDWSYGKLYALHLSPKGSTYSGELEEFVTGTPLALTDVVVSPNDGALYFAVGGRNTQSGLYRVTHPATIAASATQPDAAAATARKARHLLEEYLGKGDPSVLGLLFKQLANPDRFIRYTARAALEFQDPKTWTDKAFAEAATPESTLSALLALIHVSAKDPAHKNPGDPEPDKALGARILSDLGDLSWHSLNHSQRLDLVRVYQVYLNRYGRPDDETVALLTKRFAPLFPTSSHELNVELSQLLVYLQDPTVAPKLVTLLEKAPTQEEQIEFARDLRVLKAGWTPALKKAYMAWFPKSSQYRGGNSLPGFMRKIKQDALANLSEAEKIELKSIYDAPAPKEVNPAANLPARSVVKNWTLDELAPKVESGLKNRDYDRGRILFAAAKCFACHRFGNEGGGLGPELTGVAGRFGPRDLLESIIVPSKTISDQYEAVMLVTDEGKVVTGRIVNLNNNDLSICPDMLDPNSQVNVKRDSIAEMKPSPVSLMPEGLLNTLHEDEILDLVAYLLSRGDRENPMFRPAPKAAANAKAISPLGENVQLAGNAWWFGYEQAVVGTPSNSPFARGSGRGTLAVVGTPSNSPFASGSGRGTLPASQRPATTALESAAALLLTTPILLPAQSAEPIFNPNDFEGWTCEPQYWTIAKGQITGKAPADGLDHSTFLCSKRTFKDFELTCQVRMKEGKGNSGVQIRSRIVDPATFAVSGPQGHMGKPFWGGLYGERMTGEPDSSHWLKLPPNKVVREAIKLVDFNDYSIKCVGKHVTIKLNGKTTIDADFPEIADEGIIAWQIKEGFPAMEVYIKDIQLVELNQ